MVLHVGRPSTKIRDLSNRIRLGEPAHPRGPQARAPVRQKDDVLELRSRPLKLVVFVKSISRIIDS